MRSTTWSSLGWGSHTSKSKQAGEHYLTAIVNPGIFPSGSGPDIHRNPLTFIDGPAIAMLSKLVAARAPVEVLLRDPKTDVVEVRFEVSPEDDPDRLQHVMLVDVAKG